jgi:hypothetical protein
MYALNYSHPLSVGGGRRDQLIPAVMWSIAAWSSCSEHAAQVPLGGMALSPLSACFSTVSLPCASRGPHAAASPGFGAPARPEVWHTAQEALNTSAPLRPLAATAAVVASAAAGSAGATAATPASSAVAVSAAAGSATGSDAAATAGVASTGHGWPSIQTAPTGLMRSMMSRSPSSAAKLDIAPAAMNMPRAATRNGRLIDTGEPLLCSVTGCTGSVPAP